MLGQFLIVAGIIAVLLCALFFYAKFTKNQDSMMQGGCHGDCSNCASHCDEKDKNN